MAASHVTFEDAALALLDAAMDPSRWGDAMDRVAAFAGATGTMLIHTRGPRPGYPLSRSVAEGIDIYFREGWNLRDERTPGLPFMRRRGAFVDQDFVDRDELKRSAYYDYLRRFGINWSAGIGVSDVEEELALMIYFSDRHGHVSPTEVASLMRLRPHINAAARLSRNLAFANATGMVDAYQSLGCPSVLLGRGGRVIRFNAAAEPLIGNGLTLSRGALSCVRADDARAIAALIARLCEAEAAAAQDAPAPVVVRRSGRRPLIVDGIRLAGIAHEVFSPAKAILLISDPERAPAAMSPDLVRSAFGLTQAEATLASHLAREIPLLQAAELMGVSPETARSHLKRIFAKTDTNRQAELLLVMRRLRPAS